jgi:hypothetical protein
MHLTSFTILIICFAFSNNKKLNSWVNFLFTKLNVVLFLNLQNVKCPKIIIKKKPWYYRYKEDTKLVKMTNRCIANHAYSKFYLAMIKQINSNLCESCNEVEDVEHILFKCKEYNNARVLLSINNIDNIKEFIIKNGNNSVKKILEFVKITKITIMGLHVEIMGLHADTSMAHKEMTY